MKRKRGELVPIGEVVPELDGPVTGIAAASPQARHHFTLADQVDRLVGASEADADLGFMARMMALCSLPRTNPGNRKEYVRRNGPYKLIMTAIGDSKLPYGSLAPSAHGLRFNRSRKNTTPRDRFGEIAFRFHEEARLASRRW